MMARSAAVKVEQLERTNEYVLSAWRRLVLLVWRDKASVTGIERSRAVFDEWAKNKLGGAAFLVVVPGKYTRPPDERTRKAMLRTASSPSPQCKGMATLLEAEGFVAASLRAIVMRLPGSGAQSGASTIFNDVTEAAAWAARLLDDALLTSDRLAEAIRVVREEWGPPLPGEAIEI